MSGVYGDFIENFQELYEVYKVWTKPDRSDERTIKAVFIPTEGGSLRRRKYTSGNTSHDIQDKDMMYVSDVFKGKITVGDYIQSIDSPYHMRVTGDVPYTKAAGYCVFTVERVTGTTYDKDQELVVKEAVFA